MTADRTVDLGIPGLEPGTRIGEGGNAFVYRARQPDLDRELAVKVLKESDDDTRRRFDRERRAMGRLSQLDGIVTVYDSGYTEKGEPYLTMPLLGSSFDDELATRGPLPWREVVSVMIEVCDTVARAHEQGVVHRDLKPANIMRSNSGRPLVADFGISRITDSSISLRSTAITLTPAYSPPEALEGVAASPQADVYSLGATLYALASGSPPFVSPGEDASLLALMRRILDSPVPPLPAAIPAEVGSIALIALAKLPEDRYADAGQMAADLRVAQQTASDAPPDGGVSPHTVARAAPPSVAPLQPSNPTESSIAEAPVPDHVTGPTPVVPPGVVPAPAPDHVTGPTPAVPPGVGPAPLPQHVTGPTPAVPHGVAHPPQAAVHPGVAVPIGAQPFDGLGQPPPKRRWVGIVVGLLVLVAAGGAIAYFLTRQSDGGGVVAGEPAQVVDDAAEGGDDGGAGIDDGAATPAEDQPADDPTAEPAPVEVAVAGGGGELVLAHWQLPEHANPYLATSDSELLAASLALEPLASLAPDGTVVARLAAEVPSSLTGDISDDVRQITWTLRNDIEWADGTPLTAHDVVFTWQYCADPATGCISQSFENVEVVEAIDDHSVRITFREAGTYPFQAFVGHRSPILQQAQFAGCIGAAAAGCVSQNEAPIGTGPFVTREFRSGESASYVMNMLYRGIPELQPFFGSVEIRSSNNSDSAARSVVENGDADFAAHIQLSVEEITELESRGEGIFLSALATNVEHISLNQTNNRLSSSSGSDYATGSNPHPILFNNPVLTMALSYAIDRDEMVRLAYGPYAVASCNLWFVAGQTSNSHDECLSRDVEAAKAMLDELGYHDTDGDGIRETNDGHALQFDLRTTVDETRQRTQELLQANWSDIGVGLTPLSEEASIFFDPSNATSAWQFSSDMVMFTNGSQTPDSLGYLSGWASAEIPTPANGWVGNNFPRVASEEFDALLEIIASNPYGDPIRNDLAIRLNDILTTESGVVIPLVRRGSVSAAGSDIAGIGELNGWDSQYWNIAEWTRSG